MYKELKPCWKYNFFFNLSLMISLTRRESTQDKTVPFLQLKGD